MQHVEICRIWLWDGFQSKTFNYFWDIFKIIKKTAVVLAKFWIPVHSVNVKQHCSAGVGHVRAVDAAWLPPRQTLMDKHTHTESVSHCRYDDNRGQGGGLHSPIWARSPRCRTWLGETRRLRGPRPRCPSASGASRRWSTCWSGVLFYAAGRQRLCERLDSCCC